MYSQMRSGGEFLVVCLDKDDEWWTRGKSIDLQRNHSSELRVKNQRPSSELQVPWQMWKTIVRKYFQCRLHNNSPSDSQTSRQVPFWLINDLHVYFTCLSIVILSCTNELSELTPKRSH